MAWEKKMDNPKYDRVDKLTADRQFMEIRKSWISWTSKTLLSVISYVSPFTTEETMTLPIPVVWVVASFPDVTR